MPLKFSRTADKNGVPRASSWHVVMTTTGTPFTTNWGEEGLWYEGTDDTGVDIEVGTVQRGRDEMVFHAMPLNYRHKN
ncbi:MAG: hypothetical protein FWG47_00280 [Propionibacteriaceae bacterium]|nr:hypothetical protein [Propionibacteriaceae bacterium]